MASPRLGVAGAAVVAALTLGIAFAIPAAASLPGDSNCQGISDKTCTQTPPQPCPADITPSGIQPPGVPCDLDSLVRARAKAEVLTSGELARLCADVGVRQLGKARVAVGKEYQLITIDGNTCQTQPPVTAVPAPSTDVPPTEVPVAPVPTIVSSNLPVTH